MSDNSKGPAVQVEGASREKGAPAIKSSKTISLVIGKAWVCQLESESTIEEISLVVPRIYVSGVVAWEPIPPVKFTPTSTILIMSEC